MRKALHVLERDTVIVKGKVIKKDMVLERGTVIEKGKVHERGTVPYLREARYL